MRRRTHFALAALLVCLLAGAAAATADKPITYYAPGDTVSHGHFAYQVTGITLTDNQTASIAITLFALDEAWVLTENSFVLMDSQNRAFAPGSIGTADGAYRLDGSLTIPAGKNCALVFRVPFQEEQAAELYWVCLDGADSFSCLRFAWQPAQAAAPMSSIAPQQAPAYHASLSVSHNITDEPVRCLPCDGSGICALCDGEGRLYIGTRIECTCPQCHGSGQCSYCGGTGWIAPE